MSKKATIRVRAVHTVEPLAQPGEEFDCPVGEYAFYKEAGAIEDLPEPQAEEEEDPASLV